MFIRKLDESLRLGLKEEELFKDRLLDDIKKGDVFPAIRNNRVDFYHKGGKLFSFDGRFETHIKYATTPDESSRNYVTEKEFSKHIITFIKDFKKDYRKIKKNCELYSKGSEAAGISYLYNSDSFVRGEGDIVVLDIEIAFTSRNEENSRNQIDLLLYSKKEKKLKFVEAKLFSNKEIRAKNKPKVIGQIERYSNQIRAKKENEILPAYKNYVAIMNELFDLELEAPNAILPKTGLYIFGFDEDQKKGSLCKKIIPKLKGCNIKVYAKGNPRSINAQTLWNNLT